MRMRGKCTLILGFAFFLAALSAAAGQGDANKKDLKEARVLFRKGTSQFNSGLFDEASESFRAAYELQPNWKLQYNIAQSEAAAKRHGLALTAFETYLALGGDDIDDKRREEVQSEIDRLKKMVGFISIKAPDGATILVDGVELGTAPLAGALPVVGSVVHTVAVKTADGETLPEQKVTLVSGKQTELSFLEEKPEPAPLVAKDPVTDPGSSETTPLETPPPQEDERPKMTPFQLAGWITLGVGVAALIGAGVTGGLALSANGKVEEQCPDGCYDSEYDLLNKRDNLALATDVLFIAGGTVTAAGVALVVVNLIKSKKERNTEKTVFIHPILNNQSAGASLGLRF